MTTVAQQSGLLSRIGGLFGGGIGSAGLSPEEQKDLQRSALFQAGLATLASAQQPGGTLGGSLFSGFQAGAGALQQAQQNAFQQKLAKEKRADQNKQEDRLQKQLQLDEKSAERKERERVSGIAGRVSRGIKNAGASGLNYFDVVRSSPEIADLARQYQFDPSAITTPEQVAQLGAELEALGAVGGEVKSEPPEALEVVDVDGVPTYQLRSKAVGKRAFRSPPATTNINVGQTSEAERKDAALATRLELAMRDLGDVEAQTPGASQPTLAERGAGLLGETAANVVRDPQRRRANAAQLDALDAALTLATGAAYTKDQLNNLRTSYFPQIGDDEQTVADKQARFEAIVNVARIRAGRAAPLIEKALPPRAGSAAPSTGPLTRNADGSYTYTPRAP